MTKKTLTSFDVAAIVLELKEKLGGARIQNIYQIKGETLILKLHQPNQPPLNLLVELGRRLHLTAYLLEKPLNPPPFCMALRKHLRNGFIVAISQHEFERIVTIYCRSKEGEFRLVLELFGDGNAILVDENNVIQQAFLFKRMRDRNILRGNVFQHAPSSGKNPLQLKPSKLEEIKAFDGLEVVKALTKFLSIGGSYAEEILHRAQVNKSKLCKDLESNELSRISGALVGLLSHIKKGTLEPRIMIDKNGNWIDVVPFTLKNYEHLKCKTFKSFNEALDEFCAKTSAEREVESVSEKTKQKIARQERILEEQNKSLKEAEREAERLRKAGNDIYANFHLLQTLLHRIMNKKQSGETWQEIVSKIEEEKKAGQVPSAFFESLDTKNLVLNLAIGGLTFSLRLRASVQDNAATYYERAKKAESKVKGAEKAIAETLSRIDELKRQKQVAIEAAEKPVVKKRRKKPWYEKFRWFYTSENLLVIGGKDAVANEILIKKHMEPGDLIFHADIQGASFVLIKTEGKQPSKESINEAAQLAAAHSHAWKMKFSAVDVYWVHPEQISKTPPSGEYLRKGAFMIHGKKNYIRRAPLRLAIGIDIKTTPFTVIGGPKEAVRNKTTIYVEIIPGDLSSTKLANEVKQILAGKAPKNQQEIIRKVPVEELQAFIPYGKAAIQEY